MRRALIYIAIMAAIVSAQGAEASFNIQVSVEFISLELYHLDGIPYIMYMTDTLDPGDTTVCDSVDGVLIYYRDMTPAAWGFRFIRLLVHRTLER